MKKYSVAFLSLVLIICFAGTAYAATSVRLLGDITAPVVTPGPVVGSTFTASSTLAVTPSTTLYIESDTNQLNTCYIVITKNALWGSEASISCVPVHVIH